MAAFGNLGMEQTHSANVPSGAHDWFDPKEFSESAADILRIAGRLASRLGDPASSAVGAQHVACALFCEHPIGARLAWGAERSVDIAPLLEELKLLASAGAASAEDADVFLQCVRAHRPNFGPKGMEDLIYAIFEPKLNVAQVLSHNNLTHGELELALPKALKAVGLYQRKVAGPTAPPPRLAPPSAPPSPPRAVSATRIGAPPEDLLPREDGSRQRSPGIAASRRAAASKREETGDDPRERQEAPRPSSKRIALGAYGLDMVQQAREGKLDPVIGREDEIARVLQVLARRTKNNVCLIGAPGVGKTSVAEAVAQRIAEGRVPEQLSCCKELWSLDIGALLAGTSLRGDFEERLRALLQEIRESQGAAMLFVDELHLVLGAGLSESNNIDAANLLKPMLARGEIRCIGATTTEEYRTLILAKDAAFERRFQPVELKEPSPAVAVQMLEGLAPLYTAHHGVAVGTPALRACVQLSSEQIHGRSLPDKAIDVLDEACCFATEEGCAEVTEAHAAAVVKRWQARSLRPGPVHRAIRWTQERLSRL